MTEEIIMNPNELEISRFDTQVLNKDQKDLIRFIKTDFKQLAAKVVYKLPKSPDRDQAVMHLRQASMLAVSVVAHDMKTDENKKTK
jgi:hypothetical protein